MAIMLIIAALETADLPFLILVNMKNVVRRIYRDCAQGLA
jgi:hypothetical protein